MPIVKVRNIENQEIGELSLDDKIFAVPLNKPLIWEALKAYRAKGRAGTVATKTRGDVSGAGRKLWKQKGTGRARVASLRSPLWKGGGNVHGPQPRDWGYKFPVKMRQGAIRSVLSERLREGGLHVLDSLEIPTHKTKDLVAIFRRLDVLEGGLLVVDSLENNNLSLAANNLPLVKRTNGHGLNIYDLLRYQKIVLTRQAIQDIEKLFGGQ
jgi:large subunit ribosomal protein L4